MHGSTYDEIKDNMRKNKLDVPFAFEAGTEMHAVLFGHQISLEMYRDNNLSWTVLAPPINIRGIYGNLDSTTTKESYRVSKSEVLVDSKGGNSIYVRDLAKAALTEIEKKEFYRDVFTIGY